MAKKTEDPNIKVIRSLETRLLKSQDLLKIERKKSKQSEADLKFATEKNEELLDLPLPQVSKIEDMKESRGGQSTVIYNLSDIHYGETIKPGSVEGINSYNCSIADKRLENVWRRFGVMTNCLRGVTKIKDAVLVLNGDLISGAIHPEIAEGNQIGVVEQVAIMQDKIVSGIEYLKKEVGVKLLIPCSHGNHGRSTIQMRVESAADFSWEQLLYMNLDKYYRKDPKVEFKLSESYHNSFNVYGFKIRSHHGHQCSGGRGVAGLHPPLRRKIGFWNQLPNPAYMDILGHFHTYTSDRHYLVNGSLPGYNAYALSIAASFEEPCQSLCVIDKKRGNTFSCPIFTD